MRITKFKMEKVRDSESYYSLVKENATNYSSNKSITSPSGLADLLNNVFNLNNQAEEHLYMLSANNKNKILGVFEISHGTVNASLISPREIMIRALLSGASNIFLAHNHPSGDPTPSKEDIQVTKQVQEAGKLVGITLLDHIILGDDFHSLRENGML